MLQTKDLRNVLSRLDATLTKKWGESRLVVVTWEPDENRAISDRLDLGHS